MSDSTWVIIKWVQKRILVPELRFFRDDTETRYWRELTS
jgi:hypothetical protein